MKPNKPFITLLTLVFALATTQAFAQRGGVGGGLGAGVGLGGQAPRVGVGGGAGAGAGAQVGTGSVGVGTNADVHAGTRTSTDAGRADAHSGAGIVTRIESNPEMNARVHGMLPAGMSMSDAAAGFRNEGQFLAALHASQNLNIPFEQLKAKMTGSDSVSLGQAIKSSKPAMSDSQVKDETKKAEAQAKATASAKAAASTKSSAKQ
jgi:hypothetical protein